MHLVGFIIRLRTGMKHILVLTLFRSSTRKAHRHLITRMTLQVHFSDPLTDSDDASCLVHSVVSTFNSC